MVIIISLSEKKKVQEFLPSFKNFDSLIFFKLIFVVSSVKYSKESVSESLFKLFDMQFQNHASLNSSENFFI